MWQHLLCFKPQSGSCGNPTLSVPPLILCLYVSFLSVCLIWGGGEKTLPSCRIFEQMKPALTGGEHANPHLSSTEWSLTVVHSCPCTHAKTPWWSGGRHDKRLRNHRLARVARWEWICKKWMWERERERQRDENGERMREREGVKREKTPTYACAQYLDCLISNRHKSMVVQLHFPSTLQTDQ